MAQHNKRQQRQLVHSSNLSARTQPTIVTVPEQEFQSSSQPVMHRHIHPIPVSDYLEPHSPGHQNALLRAIEQQNALLTDLLCAVNGLSALMCKKGPS